MSRGRRHASVLVGVVAALLLAASPAGAQPGPGADPQSDPDVVWTYPPCMRATLSTVQWDEGARIFVVGGSAARCRTLFTVPGIPAGYRLATFVPGAATARAPGHNVRLFPDDIALLVDVPFSAAAIPPEPGSYGVCVIATQGSRRAACATVTVVSEAAGHQTATMQALDPDSALVQAPLNAEPYKGTCDPDNGNGFCGTCF